MWNVRSVNGCGPRCGCGGESTMHVVGRCFLCEHCVHRAIALLWGEVPNQPYHWPGDEDRDEPYQRPLKAANREVA